MPLETSPESPAPLRQISMLIGQWIGRMGAVWIEAEVTELRRRPGMCFLTLRDLQAKMSVRAKCNVRVLDALATPIVEGARVVVHAKPDYYDVTGELALDIREIRPQGEGELLAQLEARRRALAAEGLFDPRLKRSLPFLPRAIGLVTGKDSDAERDVLENARKRWPAVQFLVRHAFMQGPQSATTVIEAVRLLEAGGEVDVIVIARGGGSLHDLLPFSDEALIRAVAACTVPVVSAIGHEPDTPILDHVADHRASTPTDAAKTIVPDVLDELAGLAHARERAAHAVRRLIQHETSGLAALRSRPVLARPQVLVDAQAAAVADALERSRRCLRHQLDRERDGVQHHLARVQALSPLATIQRGYAVAQASDGSVLTEIGSVPDEFTVRLADGRVVAHKVSTQEIT
ncbi:MAG TPA: exodeoxyribonuclease VII large subunit [Aeromicrobium sp.]|nr:exodeoxyribonuclease VII large subunit [Aeromicrobium sp.]